jgi:ABC-type sugar transport system ATPase subunit
MTAATQHSPTVGHGNGESEPGRPPVLSVAGVHKSFGTTQALRGAHIDLHAGEVHALLGENGAGKSTLLKLLVGGVQPDAGELRLDGELTRLRDVRDAIGRGILPIYQQLSLIPHLSVVENLLAFELARGRAFSWSGTRRWLDQARAALDAVGLDVDPKAPVAELSLAQRQLVEIARSVMRDCRALLLDEPTTSLAADEVEVLFGVVSRMRDDGRAILFISHRLDEVERIADRVTVMRDGQTVLTGGRAASLGREPIVEAMVGRDVQQAAAARVERGAPVLTVSGLRERGRFREVELTVHEGEIVGLVGLIGSGATEVGEAIAGARTVREGTIEVAGRELRSRNRASALRAGVGFIPIDRDRDGLFPGHSILHNASVSSFRRFTRHGLLSVRRERSELGPRLEGLRVRPEDPDAEIGSASGGNRQKVLVVRNLASGSRVLIAQEPTRGVDVAARQEIHQSFLDAAASGLGILVTSSDLEEVVALCQRVLVMRSGKVVAELQPDDAGQIVRHLTGTA